MSKEGVIARQFMLGVVQTADGMPIYHEVFDGNTAEAPTLEPTLEKVLSRYPHIRRLIVVADRGLLSLDNLEALGKLQLPERRAAGIHPGGAGPALWRVRRDAGSPCRPRLAAASRESSTRPAGKAIAWWWPTTPSGRASKPQLRRERIAALAATRRRNWPASSTRRTPAQVQRGRKLSDSGAKARFFHEVCDAQLARIIKVDLKSDLFTYDDRRAALARAELMDGKLLLVTNVADLTPQRGRQPLQGAGRHRARLQGAEVRDRDRAGLPPAARAHQARTRASASWR